MNELGLWAWEKGRSGCGKERNTADVDDGIEKLCNARPRPRPSDCGKTGAFQSMAVVSNASRDDGERDGHDGDDERTEGGCRHGRTTEWRRQRWLKAGRLQRNGLKSQDPPGDVVADFQVRQSIHPLPPTTKLQPPGALHCTAANHGPSVKPNSRILRHSICSLPIPSNSSGRAIVSSLGLFEGQRVGGRVSAPVDSDGDERCYHACTQVLDHDD